LIIAIVMGVYSSPFFGGVDVGAAVEQRDRRLDVALAGSMQERGQAALEVAAATAALTTAQIGLVATAPAAGFAGALDLFAGTHRRLHLGRSRPPVRIVAVAAS
jgi:hypothetical protein